MTLPLSRSSHTQRTSGITVERGHVAWRLSAQEARELSYLLGSERGRRLGWDMDAMRLFAAADQIEAATPCR